MTADHIFIALGLVCILAIVWLPVVAIWIARSSKMYTGSYQPDLFNREDEV